ncbi:MFS transporter [Streptomyces aureocirculatus]|uniref:MFS transporter n=1 Tax=Streptomyces aureocirculatus TaxID=67275 RepID=UPI00099E0186|nr:MFS transporter [Streptomyces aureocirculatus]
MPEPAALTHHSPDPETDPKADPEADPDLDADPDSNASATADPEADPDSNSNANANANASANANREAAPDADPKTAPKAPQGPNHPRNPYTRLFAIPGATAFTVGNLIARLPMGMFSVSAVIMIAGARDSYALAGAVTATGLAATAVVAPWTARLVDRHGQARVAVPATALAVLGSLSLLLCVRFEAPDWTLFASYAATATTPNTGGMSRARWSHLLKGEPDALHSANSFEQAADELCFMLGPVLAAFLCGALFPQAGTLVGAVLLLTGVLLFTAQRSTEPPPRGRTRGKPKSPLRARGMPALLVVFLATGAVFGSMEVATIAFADEQGHKSAAGVILALQAAGSCAAGLSYGALRPSGSADRRHVLCGAAMAALMTLPLLAVSVTGSLVVLAVALLIAGTATAPTMVTGMTLVQRLAPEGQLNEAMTLAVTGLLGGIACGAAGGGWAVEHLGPTAGYTVVAAAALCALLLSTARACATSTRARRPDQSRAPYGA